MAGSAPEYQTSHVPRNEKDGLEVKARGGGGREHLSGVVETKMYGCRDRIFGWLLYTSPSQRDS